MLHLSIIRCDSISRTQIELFVVVFPEESILEARLGAGVALAPAPPSVHIHVHVHVHVLILVVVVVVVVVVDGVHNVHCGKVDDKQVLPRTN